jgi:hypothetical protein
VGVVGVAEALGVTRHAVHKWRTRYPPESRHPFPEPDIEVDGIPAWRPDRLQAIILWRETLPGRGAGGGRPTAARQDYFRMAQTKGLDREEAEHLLRVFAEEVPELTEPERCAWLMDKWQ